MTSRTLEEEDGVVRRKAFAKTHRLPALPVGPV